MNDNLKNVYPSSDWRQAFALVKLNVKGDRPAASSLRVVQIGCVHGSANDAAIRFASEGKVYPLTVNDTHPFPSPKI
jgi:hypothetical protein